MFCALDTLCYMLTSHLRIISDNFRRIGPAIVRSTRVSMCDYLIQLNFAEQQDRPMWQRALWLANQAISLSLPLSLPLSPSLSLSLSPSLPRSLSLSVSLSLSLPLALYLSIYLSLSLSPSRSLARSLWLSFFTLHWAGILQTGWCTPKHEKTRQPW